MGSGVTKTDAQQYHTNQVHYLMKELVFGDDGVQKLVGNVSANSIVTAVKVAVLVAFTDTGTDLVIVGTAADPDGLAAAVDVSSVGVKLPTTLAAATADDFYYTVDTPIYAQYDGANSDMAAGRAIVIVEYIVRAPAAA